MFLKSWITPFVGSWKIGRRQFSGPIMCKSSSKPIHIERIYQSRRATCLRELHDKGITQKQIQDTLRALPFVSGLRERYNLIQQNKAPCYDQSCYYSQGFKYFSKHLFPTLKLESGFHSDHSRSERHGLFHGGIKYANRLKHKNLTYLFDTITTNPAEWDESGLLKVRRRVDPNGPQHQCKIGCSANMCKGSRWNKCLLP
jgi:hypothetical protein